MVIILAVILQVCLGSLTTTTSVPGGETSDTTDPEISVGLMVTGYILLFILAALANAGGVGGGPITTFVIIYTQKVDPTKALGLSQAFILGGSLIAFSIRVAVKNPKKNTWLIDYSLVSLFSGGMIAGSLLGSLMTRIFQGWISIACLIILIYVLIYTTTKKAINLYKKETENIILNNLDSQLIKSEPQTKPPIDIFSVVLLINCLIFLTLYTLIKGEKNFGSIVGIQVCSIGYFTVMFIFLVLMIIQTILSGSHILKTHNLPGFNSSGINWNTRTLFKFSLISISIGILAGFLGIGGGLIFNTVLLGYNVNPEVSAACCNLLVLLSSFTAFTQFYSAGVFDIKEAVVLVLISFFGSAIGILGIKRLIQKLRRNSILVFIVCFLLIIVGLLSPISLTTYILDQINSNEFTFKFKEVC
jgi:uncharacterized membrane protein YfcA